MAFKSMKTYNEERYGGKFILADDGDSADVIFLYQSDDDVLIADAHYIKSAEYTGYVHHCEVACPACAKGIRVQSKLFIPMYVIGSDEIQFWDRNVRFQAVLRQNVFNRYPNPSEYVFRITRHGVANDMNTTYEITAVAKNKIMSYNEILAKFNAKMPDYYSQIIREVSAGEMSKMLASSGSESVPSETYEMPKYQVTPRTTVVNRPVETTPDEIGDDEVPFDTNDSELGEDDEVDF